MNIIRKQSVMKFLFTFTAVVLGFAASACAADKASETPAKPASPEMIKAYCLDFNWAGRRGNFAPPGTWKNADPKAHVAWHKAVGSNVIQTFCVSSNGWAWYKGGPVPVQPGLKHDFLREVVKLGHKEGMQVMGYFTIGANTRWGKENPTLSYGTPSTYHIPYTDKYLAYLSAAIGDAVKTTGIDGFMIDWVWQPRRLSTKGEWIDAEKKLYEQLMGEPYPKDGKLPRDKDLKYSRIAIDRCWKTIRKAAKDANPKCIIWLTCNNLRSPHVTNSDMFRQADWVMGEAGRIEHIETAKKMVGKNTRMITCMALWNGQDPTVAVPAAVKAGVGLYGFAKPGGDGTLGLNKILPRQISELTGDAQSIGVLARVYNGVSPDALWVDGKFVEPKAKPPFRIKFKRRGRGWQDTARIEFDPKSASVTVRNPYQSGRAELTRTGDTWPAKLTIRLLKRNAKDPKDIGPKSFRMANGQIAFGMTFQGEKKTIAGKLEGQLELSKPWGEEKFLTDGKPESPITLKPIQVSTEGDALEIVVPTEVITGNPASLVIEWGNAR
ncbi:MAG: hypothetical protein HN350_18040 [Phycisphaerales bacterium]|jgi:hypothetical protein|nr:hypothetical protein [Phycisphaerales bacterium]